MPQLRLEPENVLLFANPNVDVADKRESHLVKLTLNEPIKLTEDGFVEVSELDLSLVGNTTRAKKLSLLLDIVGGEPSEISIVYIPTIHALSLSSETALIDSVKGLCFGELVYMFLSCLRRLSFARLVGP